MEFKIEIEGDSEGFVSFECPYCESEFKLNAQEYKEDANDKIYCPYCGLAKEKNEFYTKEVIEQANKIAMNHMYDEINKVFGKMSKNTNKNDFIKMKFKPLKKVNVEGIRTEDSVEEPFKCVNCGKSVKVLFCDGKSKIFCSYCGEDI